MNKCIQIAFVAALLFYSDLLRAQNVAINTTGAMPNASAALDISVPNKGILIPQIALTQTNSNAPIGAGVANSLLIYNTATVNDVVPGYYFWNAATSSWLRLLNSGDLGTAWLTSGNAGTIDGINFLGTTDNVPLNFKVNDQQAGRIDHINANVFFGYKAGNSNTGSYNTGTGQFALYSNTSGNYNTANECPFL